MPAESIGILFCKRDSEGAESVCVGLCSLPSAGHQAVWGSVRKRAEACRLNIQERRHGLRSKHLLSHLIRNDFGRASIRQDFNYTDADLVPMIIDALQGSDSARLAISLIAIACLSFRRSI